MTGLVPHDEQDVSRPLAWMTPELLTWTREIWTAVYGYPVTEPEAIEILSNVKRLAEIVNQTRSAE